MVKVFLQKMQIKYVGVCMVFILLSCGFFGRALEDREVIKELLLGFRLISFSQKSDKTLVDALVNNCKLELIHVKRIYEDLFFRIPQTLRTTTSTSVHDQALSEENVQKVLSILDPQIKERLHRCLRENCDLFPVSGTDVHHVSWLQKNPRHLLPTSNHRADFRRQLAEEQPLKSTSQEDTFVIPIPVPPDGGSDATKDHQSDGQTAILVAVVVTAVATSFVSIILFLCCHKALAGGSGLELKDDRPLLSLSMSTETADHSSKTWAYENSGDKEKSNSQLFSSSFTDTTSVVFSGDKASVQTLATRFSTDSLSGGSANEQPLVLKPPPGRIIPPSPGLLPLKPPPGRPDLLPPELPVSLKPASGLNGPPPPPPPKPPTGPPPPPPPKKAGPPSPGPPPPPPPRKSGARAPPPPKAGVTPPRPPPFGVKGGIDASKTKLKPFFWDKVMANPDHAMVWDQIKAGSFQFNEEMIESLFGYVAVENKNEKKKDSSLNPHPGPQPVQLIEQKKAQNLSILLRALNVTTKEVSDALQEGNELPSELLETLIKMAPTVEEELKLRLFDGELSQLGLAERFLKEMVDIPFAFKRIEVLLFMGTLHEEATIVQENLVTLEAACKELRNSRLFLKLLEAVLKTGNRMNDGTYRGGAQAFKLDTLLKLADVKGTDGKTTLLHFVVQEIIRYEGRRAARNSRESNSMSSIKSEDFLEDIPDDSEDHFCNLGLQVVSGVGDQLQNVRKAAGIDSDSVTGTIAKLGTDLLKAKNFLNKEMNDLNEDNRFHKALKSFIQHAEGDVMQLLEEEKRIMALVKSTVDYFHGSSGKEEGLRLFVIVRDFLIMLEKVCREVKAKPNWPKPQKKEPPSRQTSTETPRTPFSPDFHRRLFPAIAERRVNGGSSSDDD
ncbi:formin-like protein 5 [Silene latifolia]|uniref:formin-like protein 5 n=1 Tax=Silene latifolia TaxID=37657 RepID=UPI003D776028